VLLDENLSPRLVTRLASLFPGLLHVRQVQLQQVDDRVIWDWAREHRHTVITADADFLELSARCGWPPKVIHLPRCDYPARLIENLLRQNAIRIAEFERNDTSGILVIASP
jgi:predicted nuclease of predicted toxin-antitoxin system